MPKSIATIGGVIPFNSDSEDLGGFVEVLQPSAFAADLAERREVKAYVNHDRSMPLATTSAGTLRLTSEGSGLRYEIDLPGTQAGRDLLTSIERRDVCGASFGFKVRGNGQSWGRRGAQRTRSLTDVLLLDVSPVAEPAYRGSTCRVLRYASGISGSQAGDDREQSDMRRLSYLEGRSRQQDRTSMAQDGDKLTLLELRTFDESKHPRAKDGKWTAGAGESGGASPAMSSKGGATSGVSKSAKRPPAGWGTSKAPAESLAAGEGFTGKRLDTAHEKSGDTPNGFASKADREKALHREEKPDNSLAGAVKSDRPARAHRIGDKVAIVDGEHAGKTGIVESMRDGRTRVQLDGSGAKKIVNDEELSVIGALGTHLGGFAGGLGTTLAAGAAGAWGGRIAGAAAGTALLPIGGTLIGGTLGAVVGEGAAMLAANPVGRLMAAKTGKKLGGEEVGRVAEEGAASGAKVADYLGGWALGGALAAKGAKGIARPFRKAAGIARSTKQLIGDASKAATMHKTKGHWATTKAPGPSGAAGATLWHALGVGKRSLRQDRKRLRTIERQQHDLERIGQLAGRTYRRPLELDADKLRLVAMGGGMR